ncbi:hypothetical protein IQ07DRAFT_584750 [Pyrenochaeta sp. DS3sAY3a]|nr:hypothetical protein IQ07DRAFT_584750 [Pyrenochaeta sp. DS3sAY3a]
MTAASRISPFDLDVAPDEELPGYDAATAPAYDSGLYHEPLTTFSLRQYDRRIQMLLGYGTRASSYRVTTNSFRLFSKKPEMELLYTSPEMRQRNIGSISFVNEGPYPWRPRAQFEHIDEDNVTTTHNMESANFTDWTCILAGREYIWKVAMRPISLELVEMNSSTVIARFTYSTKGTMATRGAEIGELTIYRDCLSMERAGIDKLVCGLMVALTHLKKMGRHYTNASDEVEVARAGSVGREHSAGHRMSSAGFSVL